jgi:glucose-6-phosphate 1-dehydrogenase
LDCAEFHKHVKLNIKTDDEAKVDDFLKLCHYVSGQYDQDDSWKELDKYVSDLEEKQSFSKEQKNRLFYMALPPSVFVPVATGLRKFVYTEEGINGIVIEKPFGKDLESASELLGDIKKLFKEEEVTRK